MAALKTKSADRADEPYERLSRALWRHVAGELSTAELARLLGTRPARILAWESGAASLRASEWLRLVKKVNKINIADAMAVLLAPRASPRPPHPFTELSVRVHYIGPLLRLLRGERTIHEAKDILSLGTAGGYHHWESGRRDIPLAQFLRAIDLLGSRLPAFCEAVGLAEDLAAFGLRGIPADFSERFFAHPWTPTIFLAVQTKRYQSLKRHDDKWLAGRLGFSVAQVVEGLTQLGNLGLVAFDGRLYRTRPGQFYAPPTLTPARLAALHEYWFSRAVDLSRHPGFHKVEQHALSRESLEKVTGWISELREKIRAEVARSQPETVVHIQWQVAEMLPGEN